MIIEFECGNQVFSPVLGHSEVCGQLIAVPDTKIGDLVPCPKCHQDTEVPFDLLEAPRRTSFDHPKPDTENPQKSSAAPNPPKAKSTAKKQPPKSSENEFKMSPPVKRSKSDLSTLDFDSVEPVVGSQKIRRHCQRCGALIDGSGRCTSCGSREQKFEKATQPIDKIKVGLAGFQLWFVQTMTESIPFKALEYGTHASIAMLTVLATLVAIFGVGFRVSIILGFALLVLIGLVASLYVALVIQGHRLASDPHARLAWFQKPFWDALLGLARRGNWQSYDQRFQGRRIIDRRGEGVTDQHVGSLEGLPKCEVLDLESTLVTDQGLRHLYGLSNLHCVVLKNTKVTHEGVFRLQQTHPKIWIWY